ncbi:MAG TPA: Rossmann-like and DUF2520 domain-containing protein [Bryobacteraceae bacterium]|jgi:predicted short-subunit dehydrogenase-like oxidoreductase (DUF2520 family)
MDSIGIAGAGRLGQALGRLLQDRGQPIAAIAGRNPERTGNAAAFICKDVLPVTYAELPSQAGRILICVPDDALPSVVATLAESAQPVKIAIHTCGSRGPEALAPLAAQGTACATMHPLQTITTPTQGIADLPGSSFGITGSGGGGITGSGGGGITHIDKAAGWALEIVQLLNGHALAIAPENRPLYHAAAVMASNYIVAMVDAAVILMGLAGVAPEPALEALGPLVRASAANSLRAGPVQALTGPIERGDERTIAAHLHALDNAPESVRQLYRLAGLHTIEVARRKTPAIDRGRIESLFEEGTSS